MENVSEVVFKQLEVQRGRQLTESQKSFLNEFAIDLDAKAAADRAGLERHLRVFTIRSLRKELQELIEMKLVEAAGKAATTLENLLVAEEPVTQANIKLESAKTILDRIGLGKKETVTVQHQGELGLFVLPGKKEKVIDGTVLL